jgi:hypothetical protein
MNLTDYEFDPPPNDVVMMLNKTSMPIYYFDEHDNVVVDPGPGPYAPRWLVYPVLKKEVMNLDIFNDQAYASSAMDCISTSKATISTFSQAPAGDITSSNRTTALIATLRSYAARHEEENAGSVFSKIFLPVFDSFGSDKKPVAMVSSLLLWREHFFKILPNSVQGITVVLENTCSGYYSYQINGDTALAIGNGDLHEQKFEKYGKGMTLDRHHTIPDGTPNGLQFDFGSCDFNLFVYPSQVSIPEKYARTTTVFMPFSHFSFPAKDIFRSNENINTCVRHICCVVSVSLYNYNVLYVHVYG